MSTTTNQKIADLFSFNAASSPTVVPGNSDSAKGNKITFSYLFFSDVRQDISVTEKYRFARDLVTFADQSGFEAAYFPERHFSEFGSIYANNGIIAAYFAPLTQNIRLRTAAVTTTLHHPAAITENWAMVDILSGGRVDLGFGNGWNKADFILSPDSFHDRVKLRNERITIIQKLWRGETVPFTGPDGEVFDTTVYPRPIQKELNVWYVTNSIYGFEYAGKMGYNLFTMLSGVDLDELGKKIDAYRKARLEAGLDPAKGIVSLMMHTFVHPDLEWVQKVVEIPFKAYIRTSLTPHMKSVGKAVTKDEVDKMVDYSYARYFQTGGIFGSVADCQRQVDKAIAVGVDDIAFLQDFGVDYDAVRGSLDYLKQLVDQNTTMGAVNYGK